MSDIRTPPPLGRAPSTTTTVKGEEKGCCNPFGVLAPSAVIPFSSCFAELWAHNPIAYSGIGLDRAGGRFDCCLHLPVCLKGLKTSWSWLVLVNSVVLLVVNFEIFESLTKF